MGTLCSCVGVFPRIEGRIRALAGLAPASQTVRSFLRTPWLAKLARKIWQIVELAKSHQWKNTLDYFSSNTFGKVKNWTYLYYYQNVVG
jgi:hypothetical protein